MKIQNRYLFDAGIFPLILAGDANVKKFVEEISSGKAELLACEVNLAEFYAKTCEKKGRETADIHYLRIRYQPKITVISPDEELTKKAGLLKCKYRKKVSLADCYAAAVAAINRATLVTTDNSLVEMADLEKIQAKPIPI
jgi:predicted nucleic acid-binding protein